MARSRAKLFQVTFPAGTRLGAWTVLDELARGGQGVVHRARHAELGTPAAIKLLLDRDEESRRRFRQEAKTLAHLRHAHLVPVLDAGALPDGTPWLVMELVEGEDLERHVARAGLPALPEVARILGAIAETLQFCHDHGVVHRDVKPRNILLQEKTGRPVLIDFGLIKRDRLRLAWSTQDAATLTQEGQLMGTPAWMPPEQADARLGDVGPASDVYALGATLFFLLTGEAPFAGTTVLNVLSAVLGHPAPDARQRNPSVPAALAELCRRCLEKHPGDRPISAAAFAEALRATVAWPAAPPRRAAASIPWAVGLVGLAVVGAGAVVVTRRPPPTGVASTTSLVAPAPAVPSPGVDRAEIDRLMASAEEALRVDDVERAAPFVERVLELDPSVARAWAWRGLVRTRRGDRTGAREDLDRAIDLDPGCADAWTHRGALRRDQGDLQGALRDLDRAIELDPRSPQGWMHRGVVRVDLGDREGALSDVERAVQLAPTFPAAYFNRSYVFRRQGDLPRALADLDRVLELDPRDVGARFNHGVLSRRLGDLQRASEDFDQVIAIEPNYVEALVGRGGAREALGDLAGARADYERVIQLAPQEPLGHANRAVVLRNLGDLPGALADLDRAIELGASYAVIYLNRSVVRQDMGDLRGSLADLDHALELDPESAPICLERGALRRKLGDLPGARADLDRALGLDPQNVRARLERGAVRNELGDAAGAIQDLEQFLTLAPEHAEAPAVRDQLERLRSGGPR